MSAGFEDISLIHNALPELSRSEIDCSSIFLGKKLSAPIMINAITGGHNEVTEINRGLARAAAATGIAMAVGSQRAALEDPNVKQSFAVAREENPKGLLLANLNALCSVDDAFRAIEMIDADGIQLHLNASQEIAMREGDTNFQGIRENIKLLARELPVAVLVKEVGFGMSREVVKLLFDAGVRHVDVSGRGGTNFSEIEDKRGGIAGLHLKNWGIPTAISLLETLSLGLPVAVVASGGVRTALDIAVSLTAGASMTAIAGPFLKAFADLGEDGLINAISSLINGLEEVMMLTGARNISALAQKPFVVTGYTAEWLQRRGIDIDLYARR